MTNDELYDLRVIMAAEGGWTYALGKPAEGGYYAAREGGGYAVAVTATGCAVQLVQRGCPGYHAMVAWRK